MPHAARFGDPTTHGGAIVSGESTVLIGGRLAARKGDSHLCPMADAAPHVGGAIMSSSATVLIGGLPAARVGDTCGCPSAGQSGAGAPPAVGPCKRLRVWTTDPYNRTVEELEKLKPEVGPHAEFEFFDLDGDGECDAIRFKAHASHMNVPEVSTVGPFEEIVRHRVDVMYNERYLQWSGDGVKVEEEAGLVRHRIDRSFGASGKSETDPLFRGSVEGKILAAEGEFDARTGDDGISLRFKSEWAVASGKVEIEVPADGILTWLHDLRPRLEVYGEKDVGSEGGGAGIEAHRDKDDGRYHFRFFLGIDALLPFEFGVGISFGGDEEGDAPPPASGPNVIAAGEPTVLIG